MNCSHQYKNGFFFKREFSLIVGDCQFVAPLYPSLLAHSQVAMQTLKGMKQKRTEKEKNHKATILAKI